MRNRSKQMMSTKELKQYLATRVCLTRLMSTELKNTNPLIWECLQQSSTKTSPFQLMLPSLLTRLFLLEVIFKLEAIWDSSKMMAISHLFRILILIKLSERLLQCLKKDKVVSGTREVSLLLEECGRKEV